MQDITMRLGTIDDFDALYAIYMAPTVNPYLNLELIQQDAFKPVFNELLEGGELYVLEAEGNVIATCIVSKQKRRLRHVANLAALAIHPACQRKGMGAFFMKHLITKLKQEGIRRIELYVQADNIPGIKFYESLGFCTEGILKKRFIREHQRHYVDDHLMALMLDEAVVA